MSQNFAKIAMMRNQTIQSYYLIGIFNHKLIFITHKNLVNSKPVIIPYKVICIRFITIYGINTGLLSAYF